MSSADQYLDQLANGKLSNSAARISDGIYEFVIKKISMIIGGYTGDSIVVEFFVLAASPQTIPATLLRPGEQVGQAQPNAVNTLCGMANNLSEKKKQEVTVNVMMGLFAAMFNWTKEYAESKDPNIMAERLAKLKQAVSGDGTTFAGYPVKCETYRAETRKTPKEIHTRTRFSYMPSTPEDIAACRKIVLAS